MAGSNATFHDEVRRHFGPLAEELGLTEAVVPTATGMPCVRYRGITVEYEICLDARDKAVVTLVYATRGGTILSAELHELVVAAELGPPQAVRTGGQTRRVISLSLASQAVWLRRLHPVLSAEAATALIRRARGAMIRQL